MSAVTGPVSTLPGYLTESPQGAMCDDHQDRPAVRRVQGETDSLGAEFMDLCGECLTKITEHSTYEGECEWCKNESADLRPQRDSDEGMCGPVYRVCGNCRTKYHARDG